MLYRYSLCGFIGVYQPQRGNMNNFFFHSMGYHNHNRYYVEVLSEDLSKMFDMSKGVGKKAINF